jgi:hypothetical protein
MTIMLFRAHFISESKDYMPKKVKIELFIGDFSAIALNLNECITPYYEKAHSLWFNFHIIPPADFAE